MSANDRQVAGSHYRDGNVIQHWDYAASQGFDYFQGQITKYVTRWRKKNGIKDLEKALHFLEKYVEVEKQKHQSMQLVPAKKTYPVSMPPPIQRLEDRLPDLTGQKCPFGYDPTEEI